MAAVLIGIVGVTGSGKSSLIKKLTEREDILVGDGSDSGKSLVLDCENKAE